ncbi:MAG: guanylate kinase [Bacteroidetes bacterium]|nr:guanylate kinase [Bacteroidota bacterium]
MRQFKTSKGKLIVFSAPSGTGKTAIKNALLQKDPTLVFSISATTRQKREGEHDGKDYYFISEAEFKEHIDHKDFIEYDHHFGNFYGTLRMAVEPDLQMGCNVVMDIDVNGALAVKKNYPEESVLIFIKPPSLEELKRRLMSRGSETEESIKVRLARVEEEMKHAGEFDHVVVNDTVERAASEILDIIRQ